MGSLEQKIQAVRHICKQLEDIDMELSRPQDMRLIEEYKRAKSNKIEQLENLLSKD
ncbi:MAG: hypothetical protein ACI4ES_12585 [Roseburia sp.]